MTVAAPEADQGAAQAAHDVGELGDVILYKEGVPQLTPQVEDKDKDQSQRNGARPDPAEGGEQNHHKYHAGSAQQSSAGETDEMNEARNQSGEYNGPEHGKTAVAVLQSGAQYQQQSEITYQMGEIGMPQHMSEKADEGEGIGQGTAVDREQMAGGPAVGQDIQSQRQQAQQRKGQGDGSIVRNFQNGSFHGDSAFLSSLAAWGLWT